ncbi:protein of unknown function (plasmid) [Streptantibioticus cattleyicolor NRRL 8057 = DSM 46488]|nr:protein of unknown function [Streptantibioticus cattleyicolor NRRL 8057 = DSM 46488]
MEVRGLREPGVRDPSPPPRQVQRRNAAHRGRGEEEHRLLPRRGRRRGAVSRPGHLGRRDRPPHRPADAVQARSAARPGVHAGPPGRRRHQRHRPRPAGQAGHPHLRRRTLRAGRRRHGGRRPLHVRAEPRLLEPGGGAPPQTRDQGPAQCRHRPGGPENRAGRRRPGGPDHRRRGPDRGAEHRRRAPCRVGSRPRRPGGNPQHTTGRRAGPAGAQLRRRPARHHQGIFGRYGTATEQLVPPGQDGSDPDDRYPHDPARASYPDGFTLPVVVSPNGSLMSQAVADDLGRIGVRLRITTDTNAAQYLGDMAARKYPASWAGRWTCWRWPGSPSPASGWRWCSSRCSPCWSESSRPPDTCRRRSHRASGCAAWSCP